MLGERHFPAEMIAMTALGLLSIALAIAVVGRFPRGSVCTFFVDALGRPMPASKKLSGTPKGTALRVTAVRAPRRSRCCPGGRPGRGGAGGRAARPRRPAAGPAARRSRRRRPRRRGRRRARRSAPSARAPGRATSSTYQPHGIAITTSGSRPESSPQLTSGDFSPGGPATSSPPAIEIISGTQWPPTKGGSSHSRAITRGGLGAPETAARTAASRPSSSPRSSCASASRPGRLAEPDHVLEHLAERARVLLEHPRLARQPRGDLEHVLVGDGADVADRLGDDQVRRQLGQPLLVELVERPALADASPSPPRRSRRRRARRAARCWVRWGSERACGRVVALVGDRDDALAEPEGEEHLRRGGNQAGDAHAASIWQSSRVAAGADSYIP